MRFRLAVALAAVACLVSTAPAFAAPVGDTFTYQGRLNHEGAAVTAPQDLEFRLFDAASDGSEIGGVNALNGVAVTHGLFSVPLNFGVGAFGNEARYLDIRVRPSGSGVAHTALTPRQPITPAPVALSVAASGVDSPAVKDGAITRAKMSADFTPILVAKSTSSQQVHYGGDLHFGNTVKNAGFDHFAFSVSPSQSGYYMVSVSLATSEIMQPGSTALAYLTRNGIAVHSLGPLSYTNNTTLNSETWVDLVAGDHVSVSLQITGGPGIMDLAPGAQFRIVRLD